MSKKIHLLVIDPQNDFVKPDGALSVLGADKDMDRLSVMVDRLRHKLDDIHVTLDSHHLVHIAHPIFWKDSKGNHPAPFTMISVSDVENGVWVPYMPSYYKRSLEYLRALEVGKRYPHVIWPPHCLISSEGHGVYKPLFEALKRWEEQEFAVVDFVTKGSNCFCEHFSVICSEVPDPNDPTTQINTSFIQTLQDADEILLAGEAGSHCLANSVSDLVKNFSNPDYIKKLVLLTDATSPVTGFEKNQEDFINEMTAKGMRVSTTVDYLK